MLTFDKDPNACQFSLLLLVQFFSFSNLYNTYRQYIYRLYISRPGWCNDPAAIIAALFTPLRHWGNCNDDGLIYSHDHCG
jgi:hypothetical protein